MEADKAPATIWEKEPLLTVRSAPRLFAWGVPAVLLLGLAIVFAFRTIDIRYAVLAAFVAQAVGIAGIYSIAQRRRTDPLKKHLPGSH